MSDERSVLLASLVSIAAVILVGGGFLIWERFPASEREDGPVSVDENLIDDNVPADRANAIDMGPDSSIDDAPDTGPADGGEPKDEPPPEIPIEEPPVLVRQPPRSWTSLFYVAYDNSIGPMEIWESDLHHLEGIGSSEDINLVALVDQEVAGDCEVLYIMRNGSHRYPMSVIDPDWPDEVSTGDPDVLYGFVSWSMAMFPADRFNLHFMDHGGGWWGAGIDESSGDFLESWEIGESLERATTDNMQRIDVMSVDACFMANVEFGYEISGAVDILVAYENMAMGETGDDGYMTGNIEVKEIWAELKEDPGMDPEEFARLIVSTANVIGPYSFPQLGMTHVQSSDCVSAISLGHYDELLEAMNALAIELRSNVTGEGQVLAERQLVLTVIGATGTPPEMNTESFSGQAELLYRDSWKLYDMYDLCERLAEKGDLLCSKETPARVIAILDEMTVACFHGDSTIRGEHPDAHGLTIYVPFRTTDRMDLYLRTDWARDTSWDEFLSEVPWAEH